MTGDAAARALASHMMISGQQRDAKWRHRFYDLIAEAHLSERDPRIARRKDGFPYYRLDVPRASGAAGTITVPALVKAATARGCGIVMRSANAEPWIFSCGDLVTQRAFGTYEFPRIGLPPLGTSLVRRVYKDVGDVSIGAPPATLLPGFVQPLLRRYFTQTLGIAEPGALAMLSATRNPPEQLVFRLSRADFPGEREFAAALAGVAWFLPRHIVLSVLEADVVAGLERAFVPLLG